MDKKLFHRIVAFIWSGYTLFAVHYLLKTSTPGYAAPLPLWLLLRVILYVVTAVILLKYSFDSLELNIKLKHAIFILFAIVTIRSLSAWVGFRYISFHISRVINNLRNASMMIGQTQDITGAYGKALPFSTINLLKQIAISIPFALAIHSLAAHFYGEKKVSEYLPPKRNIILVLIPVFLLIVGMRSISNILIPTVPVELATVKQILVTAFRGILGLASLAAGIGIFKLIRWSRILTIAIASLRCLTIILRIYETFIVLSVTNMPQLILISDIMHSVFYVVIWALVIIYLTRSNVKEQFK
ncbi:hypothetical protein ACFL0T_08510 [Candidatus Omnitrophota bacterium]